MRRTTLCRKCLRAVAFTPTDDPNPAPMWIERCDGCLRRQREHEAAEAAEAARLAVWAPHRCEADDCEIVFVPRKAGQRFHDDRCRKRTHRRRAKAAALASIS